MPPKVKTTKEAIVDAAVKIVQRDGPQALNARTVAAALGCSTQPVFSNFATMQELWLAVVAQADALHRDYIKKEIENDLYPVYKAAGMAYIRFAKEEKALFQLLYMRDRTEEDPRAELEIGNEMEAVIQKNTGLDRQQVKLFHLEMWACVHGIATMFATGFVDLPWELVSSMLTDVYQGLRKRYGLE